MPIILAFIWSITAPLVSTVVRLIGISAVVFVGMNLLVGFAVDFVLDNYNGLPVTMLGLLDLAGVNSGLVMMTSAMSAVASFKAANRLNSVWRAPGANKPIIA